MANNLNFEKYIKNGNSSTPANTVPTKKDVSSTSVPAKKDLNNVKLNDSKSTSIKTSKGEINLREKFTKIGLAVAGIGCTLGLAATGIGTAEIAAIAIRSEYNLISFETLSWGLITCGGFKLTKATIGTVMKNNPKLQPIYNAFTGAKEDLSEGKGSKK